MFQPSNNIEYLPSQFPQVALQWSLMYPVVESHLETANDHSYLQLEETPVAVWGKLFEHVEFGKWIEHVCGTLSSHS